MHRQRLFIALAVLLTGASLLPLVGLAAERFDWRRYADAYEPTPTHTRIHRPTPTATSTSTPTPTATKTAEEEYDIYLPLVLRR